MTTEQRDDLEFQLKVINILVIIGSAAGLIIGLVMAFNSVKFYIETVLAVTVIGFLIGLGLASLGSIFKYAWKNTMPDDAYTEKVSIQGKLFLFFIYLIGGLITSPIVSIQRYVKIKNQLRD